MPTRPKKRKREEGVADATRRHTGLTDILEWVGKVSGIDDDVRASFSEGDAAKILSIARYWIGSGGNTLPRLESWQVMHPLPYHEVIAEDVYGDLLRDVGRNETFAALENYRLREKIEELFAVQKGRLDGARPRTWYPDNLRGRQFTQFVSLGYHCFLTKKIKQVQARLGKKEPGKTKSLIKLEKKLENWLAQRSLAQILDWFDCIETTKVQTAMGSYRWSTESVATDRLFLKYLGVDTKKRGLEN